MAPGLITWLLIPAGVACGSDVAVVQRLLLSAVRDTDEVQAEPAPTVFFVGLGKSVAGPLPEAGSGIPSPRIAHSG